MIKVLFVNLIKFRFVFFNAYNVYSSRSILYLIYKLRNKITYYMLFKKNFNHLITRIYEIRLACLNISIMVNCINYFIKFDPIPINPN